MKKNTHTPHQELYQTLSFLFIQKSPMRKCHIWALSFFFLEGGKNINSGSTRTIPGSGFDTTSCRNRNHNKLEGRLFARQRDNWVSRDPPLCFSELPVSLGWLCLPRCATACIDTGHSCRAECFLYLQPSPHPEARSRAFLELLLVMWPSGTKTFLLKHTWHQHFFLYRFSRVQMTAQKVTCQKIADIKNVGIYVHKNNKHFAGYVTQRSIFFFSFNMVPWGDSLKSHPEKSLRKTGPRWETGQFRNRLMPTTKLLCPTIRWSIKKLNVTIRLTRTHTHTRMHAHAHTRTVTKGLSRWSCDCSKEKWNLKIEVLHSSIQKCRESDPIWFYGREKSYSFNWGSGVSEVNAWGTKSTKITLGFFTMQPLASLLFLLKIRRDLVHWHCKSQYWIKEGKE